MALTSDQEAKVLQVIDQLPAILSLAQNEALISSKLGAQKVNLSQMPSASSINPSDLLFVRQGIQDKSATAALITSTAAAGSLLAANNLADVANPATARNNLAAAPLASPVFTGDPQRSTAPVRFDSDTSLATTNWVKVRGVENSSVNVLGGNATLDSTNCGQAIIGGSSLNFTVNLPVANTCPSGSRLDFENVNAGVMTVQRQASDNINIGVSRTTIPVIPGDTLSLVSDGVGQWFAVSGSAQVGLTGSFASNLSANGYQRFPSGLIIQWGLVNTNSSGIATFFYPVAFSTAAYGGSATCASSGVYYGASFDSVPGLTGVGIRLNVAISQAVFVTVIGK